MTLRVLLVDEHPLFRRGVAELLCNAGGIEVVGETDAAGAIQQIRELQPDVVLLDAIAMTCSVLEAHPPMRLIVLVASADPTFQRLARAAGAHACVSKRVTEAQLLELLRAVGEPVLESCSISAPVLTVREREVVRGIALGYTNREIADHLQLSVKSVESYRARVNQKLGFDSRAELVRYAFCHGLLDPGA